MRAVFINLDRATERRAFMERQGERLGLALERVRAVETGDIMPEDEVRLNGRWERPLSGAELGCFLSHYRLWREIAAGSGSALVLEDDAVLSKRLGTALPKLAAFEGAEFLNLESFDRRRFVARRALDLANGLAVRRVYRDKSGSAGYLLWPAGARKLLARAERGAAPVDAFLHGLDALCSWQAEPALVMQAHILEMRGRRSGIDPATSIQAGRAPTSLTIGNLPFLVRRLGAQVRLARYQLMRLGGVVYERTPVVDEDFPPDQSRS
ncbi:glycosyltransferase family 25 protein [Aureimonas sp. ME7]|uniref:glycosyltransferase family 25 protein n=1 Tax=Aureimonas sp. ME7 TaxID=2744252 RepID=UPI0015F6DDF6|nr:glycosyltransferase family 25 protein [Aureimonas sp. ME7]